MWHHNCVTQRVLKQGRNYSILTGELPYVHRALIPCISDFISRIRCKTQNQEDFSFMRPLHKDT